VELIPLVGLVPPVYNARLLRLAWGVSLRNATTALCQILSQIALKHNVDHVSQDFMRVLELCALVVHRVRSLRAYKQLHALLVRTAMFLVETRYAGCALQDFLAAQTICNVWLVLLVRFTVAAGVHHVYLTRYQMKIAFNASLVPLAMFPLTRSHVFHVLLVKSHQLLTMEPAFHAD